MHLEKIHVNHYCRYTVLCLFFIGLNAFASEASECRDVQLGASPCCHLFYSDSAHQDKELSVSRRLFGHTPEGDEVYLYRLSNGNDLTAEIIEYGAILARMLVPDVNGVVEDVVLGYDNLQGYIDDPYYFGATIGRVANRIGGASFALDGETFDLAPNTLPDFGNNHLHGGVRPFNKVVWKGSEFRNEEEVGVVLEYLSKDGEEGYPGNLICKVTYSLNEKNELKIEFNATSDKTTVVNMTHHSYFNLEGEGSGNVLDQEIFINANKYTPADENLIPTGKISEVSGLPVDFTTRRTIGSRILKMKSNKFTGYDLNYVLNYSKKDVIKNAGRAMCLKNGRVLDVHTTQPCMHFYTSNFLDGKLGKGDKPYVQYGAFCFEPQGYPDAPNQSQFDSVVINPGEEYEQTIIYRFSTLK